MRISNLLAIFFFLIISFSKTYSQTCQRKNQLINQIEKAQNDGNYDCSISQKKLKTTLNDCLKTTDSLDTSLWNLYHEIGFSYYACGPEEKAIPYFYHALEAIQNSIKNDFEDIGRIYKALGLTHGYLDNIPPALEAMKKAVENFKKVNSNYLPGSYTVLGNLYNYIGDYAQAMTYLDKAEKIIPKKNYYDFFLIKKGKVDAFYGLEQYESALKEYQKGMIFLEKDGIDKHQQEYAQVNSDIGELYFRLEKYQLAAQYNEKAFELFEEISDVDFEALVTNYNFYIRAKTKLGQYNNVTTAGNKVITLAKTKLESSFYPRVAETYHLLGKADLEQKKNDDAIERFQKAIELLIPRFQPKELYHLPVIKSLVTGDKKRLRKILTSKALAFQQKFQENNQLEYLEYAFKTYQKLDTLITQTRQGFKAVGSKYYLQETIIPIYEKAIMVCLQLRDLKNNLAYQEAAYHFIARNKAIILIEGIRDEQLKWSKIPEDLLVKERELKKTVFELEIELHQAEQEKKTKKIQTLNDQLFETKITYANLIDSFELKYPHYNQDKYKYYSDVGIKDIQSNLEKNRAVIEFFIGEESLFVSVLSNDVFEIFKSDLDKYFLESCKKYIDITRGNIKELENLEVDFSNVSHQLYKYLLKDALDTLDDSITRLTIIPDDILLHISFDALLTEPFKVKQWFNEKIPYLLRKYSTSQIFASSLLFESQKQNQLKKTQGSFVGFGLEYYDYTKQKSTNISGEEIQKRLRGYGHLVEAEKEVKEIQQIVGGDILLGKDALKVNFLDTAAHYQIIHVAAHGFGDEDNALGSSLILAKLNQEDKITDYQLSAADIYSMKLNAELVVLSACQTNYGAIQKGEGMRTLSRAFTYAGCSSLVASSWLISDNSSKEIMVDFYKKLKLEGHSKDVALQLAKLKYLKETDTNNALPSFWAHLNIIGDVGELAKNNQANWWFAGTGLIVIILIGIIVINQKTRIFKFGIA